MVNFIVSTYENDKIFFFEIQFWEIEHTRQMTGQENDKNLGKFVFDFNN